MPTVHLEANLSAEQLLQAVRQMNAEELENFTRQVLAVRASRQAPQVDQTETELLLKINQGLPDDFRRRNDELIAKRQAESLTPEEHQELIRLGEEVERWQAERVQALAALAQMRQISLDQLVKNLGLDARPHE